MIISRKMKREDFNQVLNIVGEELYFKSNSDIIYILEDSDGIKGVCGISKYEDFGILDYIIIKKEAREENFGDGLMRATFNYCLRKGLLQIYFLGYNSYLIEKGFIETNQEKMNFNISRRVKDNKILICDLPDFFSRKCCK